MENYKYTEHTVDIPTHDCDVNLKLPNGKVISIQFRPSNADTNYNGSLDFILPYNEDVTCWQGDDMDPAPGKGHERYAKQLMMELPFNPYMPEDDSREDES